jgi:mono/diheme cytochrome c family protein
MRVSAGALVFAAAAVSLACSRTPADTRARFAATPARVERGRYLVTIAQCLDCHSNVVGIPPLPDPRALGAGDVLNDKTELYAPNLTSDPDTGLGRVPDSLLVRAIRQGVGWDGRRLHAAMPWSEYSAIADEDVRSIVVYLRSLPPVKHALPRTKPNPTRVPLVAAVAPTDPASLVDAPARGAYLVRIGRCVFCHTPFDRGGARLDMERAFSGGRRFVPEKNFYDDVEPDPALSPKEAEANGPDIADLSVLVASQNLTPHPSGIPHYDAAMFVRTIRTGRVNGVRALKHAMPWYYFRHMTDADLGDVFAYLKTLPPKAHRVDNERKPTFCPVCGRRHGGGDDNPGGSP